ncbi:hypothetical protein BJ165DRAFT_1425126 [Panaeolus papilionaceus]|nr:hypothetical protein BJ165DRAFT_1425126 [Panaeolus papilionaceus]
MFVISLRTEGINTSLESEVGCNNLFCLVTFLLLFTQASCRPMSCQRNNALGLDTICYTPTSHPVVCKRQMLKGVAQQ